MANSIIETKYNELLSLSEQLNEVIQNLDCNDKTSINGGLDRLNDLYCKYGTFMVLTDSLNEDVEPEEEITVESTTETTAEE